MRPAVRKTLVAGAAVVVVAVAAGLWILRGPGPLAFAGGPKVALADYRGADPTGVPAALAKASPVERGEYLARAADCMVCHTVPGGKEYAGGLAFKLPFGTLYSTNITPDKETGIGNYSDREFLDAMHRGVRRDGARLYPAMPFTSYTYITDADALAIKAYLFSLPPVRAATPPNTLMFPFNQRWSLIFWSTLFNPDKRFEPDTAKTPEWNRGAYLAEALAHCGECHTPRNLAFALDNREKFAGALTAGWRAYNITSDKGTGVGAWTDDELVSYLSTGHATGRGTASGPMGEAVDHSLSRLAPEDIRALVAYLRTVPAIASPDLPATLAPPAPASHKDGGGTADARGKMVFAGACVSCHGWTRPERDSALRHADRRAGGQRSRRHQCGADRDLRDQAAYAAGRPVDAGLRQHLLRCRDRGRRQLRHRALRQQGIADHRAGRRRLEKANGRVVGRHARLPAKGVNDMAGRLKDKVAIVVGAGSSGPGWGNGKCTAVTFAREGARVMCVDRKRAAAEETVGLIAKEGGGEAVAFEADSSKNADVKAMVDACLAKWGRIDVLDNNVGIGSTGGPVELSEDEWHLVFDVNVKSFFLTAKHVLPVMEKQGKGAIVNVSSIASIRSPKGVSYIAYNASKGAVNSLTLGHRLAVRRQGHPLQRHPARADAHADDRFSGRAVRQGREGPQPGLRQDDRHPRSRLADRQDGHRLGHRQCRTFPRVRRGGLRQRPPAGGRRRHHRPRVSTKREMNGLVSTIRNRRKRWWVATIATSMPSASPIRLISAKPPGA